VDKGRCSRRALSLSKGTAVGSQLPCKVQGKETGQTVVKVRNTASGMSWWDWGAAGGRGGSVEGWRRVQTVRQERQSEEGDSRTREGLKGPPVGAN
jgi:hypothetical protein